MGRIQRLAKRGDPEKLKALLEAGADPNEISDSNGETAIFYAAKGNNLEGLKVLIAGGATLDVVNAEGKTPLMVASNIEIKRSLLEAGANPDFGRIAGQTFLATIAPFKNRELIDLLIAFGADTSEKIGGKKTIKEYLEPKAVPESEPALSSISRTN